MVHQRFTGNTVARSLGFKAFSGKNSKLIADDDEILICDDRTSQSTTGIGCIGKKEKLCTTLKPVN